MSRVNILLRCGGGRNSGWSHILRTVALEEHLRAVWPQARVTVFAEGDHEVHDHLYSRVRDLVGLRPGIPVGDDLAAREGRGPADLVLFDVPSLDPECREVWMRDARHVVVREPLEDYTADDQVIAGRRWSAEGAAGLPLAGSSWAILDPGLAHLARERGPRRSPARHLLVAHEVHDPEAELRVAREVASCHQPWTQVTWLAPQSGGRAHREALQKILPAVEQVATASERGALYASADLAVVAGGNLRHALAASGTPTVIFSVSQAEGENADIFAAAGAATHGGRLSQLVEGELAEAIDELASSPARLSEMAARAMSLVDGAGWDRLLATMLIGYPRALADLSPVRLRPDYRDAKRVRRATSASRVADGAVRETARVDP